VTRGELLLGLWVYGRKRSPRNVPWRVQLRAGLALSRRRSSSRAGQLPVWRAL